MSTIQFHYYCKNLHYKQLGLEEDDFEQFLIKKERNKNI